MIVYIHGGAYVNDITGNHLKLLGKIASNENVKVYIPIYPYKLILLSHWIDITMENKDILNYESKYKCYHFMV